jgi:hypothetical protein
MPVTGWLRGTVKAVPSGDTVLIVANAGPTVRFSFVHMRAAVFLFFFEAQRRDRSRRDRSFLSLSLSLSSRSSSSSSSVPFDVLGDA